MKITKSDIDNGKSFDWGRTSEDYAKFRDIYPDIFYKKIVEMGLCVKGQRVLDIGTGTGVLPRNLYKYGAEFIGSDISENQIEQARLLSAGMNISYVVSPAETVDFPEKHFDAVTACQCYQYFDKSVVFPKIHSILKDSGHFCILFMAWIPDESEIAANSEKMILKYNPSWSGHSMKRFAYDFPDEAKGLFEVENSFGYDAPVTFTRESWHGRMKACRGIGASSLSADKIAEFEREHIEYLKSVPEIFDIPHFVTVFNLRKI
ncbi:MAG: class I SAM-dependent methyltransferase [Oscillospiraceae bacterium]|nr:class I SAM-dependent methyltransferase [Oscillospiraceae bacterium]